MLLEGNFSLITQPGDWLRLPEAVSTVPGLPEAPGRTLAQGKEMESSLDLLLLLLWESIDLCQEDTREDILLRRTGRCFQSGVATELSAGSFIQTMAKGSLGPSGLQALSFFCFFLFCCFTPLLSACVIVVPLENSLKRRQSRTKDKFTELMPESEKPRWCRTYGLDSVIVCRRSAAVRSPPHVAALLALISGSREGQRVTAWLADTGPPSR